MENLVIGIVLLMIIGAAVCYIVKAKKRGVKCIGCPAGSTCSHNCSGGSCGGCSCGGSGNCACHTDIK